MRWVLDFGVPVRSTISVNVNPTSWLATIVSRMVNAFVRVLIVRVIRFAFQPVRQVENEDPVFGNLNE
jgi:hypothetical protein